MDAQQIKEAVDQGLLVYWKQSNYRVTKSKLGHYNIVHDAGSAIGLTWLDGVTLNGDPEDFFVGSPAA